MAGDNWQVKNSSSFFFRVLSIFIPKPRHRENRKGALSKIAVEHTGAEGKADAIRNMSTQIRPQQRSLSQWVLGMTVLNPLSGPSNSEPIPDHETRPPAAYGVEQMPKTKRVFGDRERTEKRYNEAVKQLEKCIAIRPSNCESLYLFAFDEIRQNNQIPFLREKIDEMLEARKSEAKNRSVIQRIFTAMVPFSKSLLAVVVQSQSVR